MKKDTMITIGLEASRSVKRDLEKCKEFMKADLSSFEESTIEKLNDYLEQARNYYSDSYIYVTIKQSTKEIETCLENLVKASECLMMFDIYSR